MAQTIVEKIFSRKLNKKVKAGDTVFAPVDLSVATDGTAPLTIEALRKMDVSRVKSPEKIVLINDHFVPAKDIKSANLSKMMRQFARAQSIVNYYEIGRSGICHITVPESGLVNPGDIVVGADSHTCTYGALGAFATGVGSTDLACAWAIDQLWFRVPETVKVIYSGMLRPHVSAKDLILYLIGKIGVEGGNYRSLEISGDTIEKLDMAGRFTICNMVIETGAKCGVIAPDRVTLAYLSQVQKSPQSALVGPDENARYSHIVRIDVSEIEPLIARPFDPSNIVKAADMRGHKIDQVVIGSCTNGRIEDFRIAHKILKGKKVHDNCRLILIPGSPNVYKQLLHENLMEDFINAGAAISPSTCGPCIGGHMGVLAAGETGLFTTNRNYYGRNGDPESQVYLCSPAIAACSAISGSIQVPA